MEEKIHYNINFFSPHTPFLKDNVRLIVISVLVWAVAVFGFHLLLKILEKPVKEPAYIAYEKVWPVRDSATIQQKQELAKSYLTLTGKYISLRSNQAIHASFTQLVHQLLPQEQKAVFLEKVTANTGNQSGLTQYKDDIAALLKIENGLLKEAIPYTLGVPDPESLKRAETEVPKIMDSHLIHYRSILTDTKVFGFPLHYFYTAVFLKILFCLICLFYCRFIDRIMKKHGLETVNE